MKKTITRNFIRKTTLIVALIIGSTFTNSGTFLAQGWQWAKNQGGLNNDAGRAICTDPSGNVIVAGGFSAPSIQIGTVTVNSVGGGDIYLAKFDPAGNILWVQTFGGTGLDIVGGVCTSTNGNIYVSGSYDSPTLTIGPYNLPQASTAGNFDCFIAQFTTNGSVQWATKFGSPGNEQAQGCTYSSALNNVLLTGSFSNSTLSIGGNTLTNTSSSVTNDIFLAKFNVTFGSVTGAFSTGGANSSDYGYSVRADATSFYIGGSFSPVTGSVSTIGGAVTSYGSQDPFLVKYNNSNTFQWVRNGGSTGGDYFGGMDIDAAGSLYITGAYYGTQMIVGTTTLTNLGTSDGFVAKYNSAGTFQWANKVSTTGQDFAYDVTTDANNNVYLAGYFGGTVAVVGAYTLTNTTPGTYQDVFVVKYNSAGTAQWASSATGINGESVYSAAADAIGNVYITGSYNIAGPMSFGTTTLNSNGNNDAYVAKIGCLTAIVGGASSVCAGSSATLTASGATSYTWSTGATTNSIVITPTTSTTYSVIGATGTCTDASSPYSVTLLPNSINTGGNLNLLCNQSQTINASTSPAVTNATWTPTAGLTAPNTLSAVVNATASPMQYSITATLNNGCIVKGTVAVTRYAPKPDICMVSVNSLGINNEIFWEKTLYANVDSFIVYREASTNIYKRIAAISNNNFSGYTDTSRSVGPANGDPNFTSYKYKLQIRDVCGNYSALSYYHQTLFIQDQQNGNFNWNIYTIESSPTPVSVYDLYRVDLATSTYSLITSTTANLATDPAYSTWQTTAKWRVQANGFNCNPTNRLSPEVLKIKTKSNIKNDRLVGIKSYNLIESAVSTYPSPANESVHINGKVLSNADFEIELQNALGQVVYTKKYTSSSNEDYEIGLSPFANGVYFINVKQQNKTVAVKKIVVSK